MFRPFFLLVFLISGYLKSYSQQGNNWYFGGFAGISFNTPVPSVLTNGALNTDEGCASISDNTGKLLFYTDGRFVWNNLHQVMPNGSGLFGDPSSSNSAIIIPKPGSNSIYYIFTADAAENTNVKGYNYSEVDMSLNGGLGDVTSNKNVLLYAPSTEKLTAFRCSNGIDIWVVTHAWGNNSWLIYKVTCTGVNLNPIVSNSGTSYTESSNQIFGGMLRVVNDESVGCVKASPDGKFLASTTVTGFGSNFWEIFNFDNSTGIVSNPVRINQTSPYGVEFSPDSKLLYVATETINYASGTITQYSLVNYDFTDISSSAVVIGASTFNTRIGALQLGPDNKIYCALEVSYHLATINNPNNVGTACNFVLNQVNLNNGLCLRGLPVIFPSLISNQNANYTFNVSPDCSTVSFAGTSTVTGTLLYSWDFNDGTVGVGKNIVHTFSANGFRSYQVKLTVTSDINCGNAMSVQTIDLNRSTPTASFDFTHVCGSLNVTFTDKSISNGSAIQNWLWDFGDGQTSIDPNPVHTFANFGLPMVSLKVTSTGICNGSDIDSFAIPIEAKPNIAFSTNATCIGRPVQFYDQSTIESGVINKWYWDFGDGNFSTQQNPTNLYSKLNLDTVKLVSFSSTGCQSDTLALAIQIGDLPKASWSVLDTCFGKLTSFTGLSSVQNATTDYWNWNFGDASSIDSQNPTHSFQSPGKYIVSLSTITSDGCESDTIKREITIGSKPTGDFSYLENCGNLTVGFQDLSTNTNESISRWAWNFGDGNLSLSKNPTNIFPQYIPYQVKLLVSSTLGCLSDTVTKKVDNRSKPVANFILKNGCENQVTQFEDASTLVNGSIVSRSWDFGNSTSASDINPQIVYPASGKYLIKLVVESDKQCFSDTVIQEISIESKPVSKFEIGNGCVGSPISIENLNTINFGEIESTYWSFGNNDESNNAKPVYSYLNFGDFLVKEVAISKNGCISDTASQLVKIESNPVVDFSFGKTCENTEIDFINLSSNESGSINTSEWDFANGDKSPLFQTNYTYSKFGQYPVTLTEVTDQGCSSSKTKIITIAPIDISAGDDTLALAGKPIRLLGSGADTYTWSPAEYLDNSNSSQPIATLSESQIFTAEGTTKEGCTGSAKISITVFNKAGPFVPNAFTPNGDGKNDVFKPVLPGISTLVYFTIFNRWGQRVFNTSQVGQGWDGTFNGSKAVEGTYVWMLKAIDYKGQAIEEKGTVILLR